MNKGEIIGLRLNLTQSEIIGLVIVCAVALLLIVISIILLCGRGSFLIAGFNTKSKEEKEKYNVTALCRFAGIILLPIGLLCPVFALAPIFDIFWLIYVGIAVILCIIFFAVIYVNTGNRFKK